MFTAADQTVLELKDEAGGKKIQSSKQIGEKAGEDKHKHLRTMCGSKK